MTHHLHPRVWMCILTGPELFAPVYSNPFYREFHDNVWMSILTGPQLFAPVHSNPLQRVTVMLFHYSVISFVLYHCLEHSVARES